MCKIKDAIENGEFMEQEPIEKSIAQRQAELQARSLPVERGEYNPKDYEHFRESMNPYR